MSKMSNDRNSSSKPKDAKVDFLSLEGELKDGKVYFQGKSMSELARGMDESYAAMSNKTEQALAGGASQVAQSSPDHLYIYERQGDKIVLHTFKIPQALQAVTLKEMGIAVGKEKKSGEFDPVAIYGDEAKIEFAKIPQALDVLTGTKHTLETVTLPKIEKVEVKVAPQEIKKSVPVFIQRNAAIQDLNLKKTEPVFLEKKPLPVSKEEFRPRASNTEQIKTQEHWHLKEKKRLIDPEVRERKEEVRQQYIERKPAEQIKTEQITTKSASIVPVNYLAVSPKQEHQALQEQKKAMPLQEERRAEIRSEIRAERRSETKENKIDKRPDVLTKAAVLTPERENARPLKRTLSEKIAVKKVRRSLPEPYNIFVPKKETSISLNQSVRVPTIRQAPKEPVRVKLKNVPAPNLDSLSLEPLKRPTRFQKAVQVISKLTAPLTKGVSDGIQKAVKAIKENKVVQNVMKKLERYTKIIPAPIRNQVKVVFTKAKALSVKVLAETKKQITLFAKDIGRISKAVKNLFNPLIQKAAKLVQSKSTMAHSIMSNPLIKRIKNTLQLVRLKRKRKEEFKLSVRKGERKKIILRPKLSRTIFAIPRKSTLKGKKKLKKKIRVKKKSGMEDLKSQELIWDMMKKSVKRKRKFKHINSSKTPEVI